MLRVAAKYACGRLPRLALGIRTTHRAAGAFALHSQLHPTGKAREVFPVENPASGHVLGHVCNMTAGDAEKVIEAAHAAFPAWRDRTAKDRATLLRKWASLITHHSEYLSTLITAENGKPLAEARGETTYGNSFITWFAEEAIRVYGETIPASNPNQRILVLRQPVGVSACITPWNFPLAMITRKVAPALAAGCTVVIKPGEDTPLTAQALVELAVEAGIPRDVVGLVTCDRRGVADIGKLLATHPLVRKVSFTGSTAVGKQLLSLAAASVKRVSMELGGNAPFIVFDDADVNAAVSGAMASKFRNSGQTCVCVNRIFVQEKIYPVFLEKLVEAVKKLKVGDGSQPNTHLGPLINDRAVEKVEHLINDAVRAGAKLALGGARHELGRSFFQPTVLADVTPKMKIDEEEIFGPVACVSSFKTDAEVVARANNTNAGLMGYFYTQNLGRAFRVAESLEYGMVAVNAGAASSEVAPFGGVKESGIGREGSRHGILEYLDMKYVLMDLGAPGK